jgi:Uncharacterized protein conserved in bacteria (DUF2188)
VFSRKNGYVAEREQQVRPSPAGGWDVVTAGFKLPSSHHETNLQAIVWARTILRQSGGGRVICFDQSGSVRETETV